ncbi:MAG: amidohydrolase [Lachnospiraceae bacterium]|nr:amidohydrolase [Lachnospiraceae bacterium]
MKTIYYNGIVYTGTLPLVEAFVVEDEHFIFAGSNEEAKALAVGSNPAARFVDLDGRFVCSGFNDSHMHLLNYGNALSTAQLAAHTESLADMLDCLSQFEAEHPHSGSAWLMGRGWNQDYFTDVKRMPNRYDLDQVSTEVPICAVRACGHCLIVNSKALELLGVTVDTPQPDGGHIGIEDGVPDGRFFDNAMNQVYDAIPVPDKAALKDMIRTACKALNSYGITSSQTDDYCVYRQVPWQTVNEAYQELEASGELTVRVYEQSNFTTLSELKKFVKSGHMTGAGSSLFKIGPLKLLGDGSLGSRTAFLSQPYADDPSTCGLPVFSQETLDEMIGYANAQGMQVAVHAIGDACLDRVLNAYEKALREHPRKDHRHGIVHCQITRADQLQKIEELGLHIYAQSIFLDYDNHIIEARVGRELAATSYNWKTLMRHGICVSNGTDCPVELPDALASMQCAVTRTTLHDHVGPYLPDQCFTVQEALDSYTSCGARGSFEETLKGQIKPGMLADFVVLGKNPFEVDVAAIKDIPVCETWLGGVKVY